MYCNLALIVIKIRIRTGIKLESRIRIGSKTMPNNNTGTAKIS